jgi:hypothetical protein
LSESFDLVRRRGRARKIPASILAGIVLLSAHARAADPPRQAPWLTGWYAPVGLVTGASFHHDAPGGLVLGAEQSLVYQRGPRASGWAGLYVDGLRDFGAGVTRFSLGPELGYGPVGVDGGVFAERRDGQFRPGFLVRGLLTAGFLSAFVRWGRLFDDLPDRSHVEIGLLLKLPLSLGYPPATAP